MTKLLKSACFTDIHFGRKNNSELHNQDCLRFIEWFCDNVKKDKDIDNVVFLGDWFEHRSSVDGLTLHYSDEGFKKLNELGIPVFIIVGNHDLYYRSNRNIYTTKVFDSLENIQVIQEPKVIDELGEKGCLISPYLFHKEYGELLSFMDIPVWFGHFEFKGFVLTGEHTVMKHGPDAKDYKKIKRIFCGHFHKRQSSGNVHYIGNAFPADFSDANDNNRGMMVYDHTKDNVEYINWDECPKYIVTNLSEMIENPNDVLCEDARVRCIVDTNITLQENNEIKEKYTKEYGLRELKLDESNQLAELLSETEHDISEDDMEKMSINETIVTMLGTIESDSMDNEKLQEIYRGID